MFAKNDSKWVIHRRLPFISVIFLNRTLDTSSSLCRLFRRDRFIIFFLKFRRSHNLYFLYFWNFFILGKAVFLVWAKCCFVLCWRRCFFRLQGLEVSSHELWHYSQPTIFLNELNVFWPWHHAYMGNLEFIVYFSHFWHCWGPIMSTIWRSPTVRELQLRRIYKVQKFSRRFLVSQYLARHRFRVKEFLKHLCDEVLNPR